METLSYEDEKALSDAKVNDSLIAQYLLSKECYDMGLEFRAIDLTKLTENGLEPILTKANEFSGKRKEYLTKRDENYAQQIDYSELENMLSRHADIGFQLANSNYMQFYMKATDVIDMGLLPEPIDTDKLKRVVEPPPEGYA